MPIDLRPERIKRRGEIARLLVKHGRSDLVRSAGLDRALDPATEEVPEATEALADELATDLERLGPTYVKLGQLLSTRADILPLAYIRSLSRLQDAVEPLAFEEVERIVSSELGARLIEALEVFDPSPVAEASLGQVHRAALVGGQTVAVKVQRPNIREQLLDDFDLLRELAGLLDTYTDVGRRYEFRRVIEELRVGLMRELDFRLEAANLTALGKNLARFAHIVVPQPVDAYTTARVLTTDYIRGAKVTAATPPPGVRAELADELFHAYLRRILVDGFFHADPHPGNILLTEDNKLALLDLGLVGKLAPELQESLLQLLLAVGEGRREEAAEYGSASARRGRTSIVRASGARSRRSCSATSARGSTRSTSLRWSSSFRASPRTTGSGSRRSSRRPRRHCSISTR